MAAATVLARRVNRLLVTFLIPTTGWIAPDNLTAYSGGDGLVMEVGRVVRFSLTLAVKVG